VTMIAPFWEDSMSFQCYDITWLTTVQNISL